MISEEFKNNLLTCTKKYTDFPYAHRQPRHDGHCAYIHGHNSDFEIEFCATERDSNGFIIDFGKLGYIKEFLTKNFDHTFIVPEYDPEMSRWTELYSKNLIDLRILPDTSAEGIAKYVLEKLNELVKKNTNDRVWITRLTVWEDSKNSATYYNL